MKHPIKVILTSISLQTRLDPVLNKAEEQPACTSLLQPLFEQPSRNGLY